MPVQGKISIFNIMLYLCEWNNIWQPDCSWDNLRRNIREFKIPTTNNGYGIRLTEACFRIALTKADNIYIFPEHSFHRSDLGYSVKITFLCCKTESRT